ncbi:serine hydrolase domain-containing protein [Leptospira adleri]|uniref:Beta-lactamase-related domain-containing protein n=1 Tax=Leptospira adleri TaxID=2023186 RepID=A0A2M9YQB3_9LEPT|nr:serine hydrolase [Leptospira adleri]PJZ53712.1 hypothetical protein CH380_09000 [Leptospira adleri]PJZ61264.1 hypothetical protein CH376_14240 [Leptospira adleri]
MELRIPGKITLFAIAILITNCHPKEDDKTQDFVTARALIGCISLDECFSNMASLSKTGASFQVFKKNGTRVYLKETGDLTSAKTGPIFSASKLVTASLILRLVDQGLMSLDETTGTRLGWTGVKGQIKLRQLLAFTSGLNPASPSAESKSCIFTLPAGASVTDKNNCVTSIRDSTQTLKAPGDVFYYNSFHMAVAQRMAEIAAGQTWQQIFDTEFAAAGKMNFSTTDPDNGKWYADIANKSGDGSLAGAYGLFLNAFDYSKILNMLINDGIYTPVSGAPVSILTGGSRIALIRELFSDQYQSQTTIEYSQFAAFGYRWHYGLGNWRFCSTPDVASTCEQDIVYHSFGANGFYPWIDRNSGYYAVVGVNNFNTNLFSVFSLIQPNSTSLFFGQDAKRFIPSLIQ